MTVSLWPPREPASDKWNVPTWQAAARCAEVGDDFWFPEKGGTAGPAKAICRGCVSRLPCLRYALGRHDDGIWGGFTERERRAVSRQHGAGQSLEDIIAADDARYYAAAERGTWQQRRDAAARETRRRKREAAASGAQPRRAAA